MYIIFPVVAILLLCKHMRFEFSIKNFLTKKALSNRFVIQEIINFLPSTFMYVTIYVVTRRACGF